MIRKFINRFFVSLFIVALLGLFSACGGSPHWGTSAGVDLTWGPNGPKVRPNVSVGVYNGGHW
ncbi:hypothetical protein [Robertkochia solimangrovi]|uniref:hypothetical protein n=1 Tax=Robertkochia solimangrovi TaxID=2213046 RepID=UPI00117C7682|nr:hypothetical protein [Robertkochia solimangrovi]